jgi:hypothetical protein
VPKIAQNAKTGRGRTHTAKKAPNPFWQREQKVTTMDLADGWRVNLGFDPTSGALSGGASLAIPNLGTVSATVTFTAGLALNAIDVNVTSLDIPIGDTGFFLDSVDGAVSNIGPNQGSPELSATFGISFSPENAFLVPAEFDATGTYIAGKSFGVSVANGKLADLDGISLGTFQWGPDSQF